MYFVNYTKMNKDKYLIKLSTAYLESLSVEELLALRQQVSQQGDLDALCDIATFRFINGSITVVADILPEMCFLYGKSHRLQALQGLLKEYNFTLALAPQSCIETAKTMLYIGLDYPNLDEDALSYLEALWCDSGSYEWMDIIMYDVDKLPRKLRRFEKSLLGLKQEEFSEQLIIAIWECFERNKKSENEDEPFFFDRKTNKIGKKPWWRLGKNEFVIENDKQYNEVNKYISDTFGREMAYKVAKNLMFSAASVEEFQNSPYHTVSPQNVYDACDDKGAATKIAEWFCLEFLRRCNQ